MGHRRVVLGDHTTSPEDFIAALWGDDDSGDAKSASDSQPNTRAVKPKDRHSTKQRPTKKDEE